MKITAIRDPIAQVAADAVIVGVLQDDSLAGPASELNSATSGVLDQLIEQKEITGKRFELVPILAPTGVQTRQILVVGLGKRESLDRGTVFRATATAVRHLAGKQRSKVALCLGERWAAELHESAVAGALVGCHGQDLYRAEKTRRAFDELLVGDAEATALTSGEILGESVNLARHLVDQPPSEIYPESFAQIAQDVAAQCGMKIEVWDPQRLESERCGSLLAVARGSVKTPRLVIMRYAGGSADTPTLGLVGKGVTFDSGGLSLKPSNGMVDMKCDMAGAASVLGAMQGIARLKLPVNVIGLMGLVENMVSGTSYKLGDVLTARNGRTIEVRNTDAEGRLVLADTLAVAVDEGASKIIDLATLTGACVVALGNDVVGLMSNDQGWCDQVAAAAGLCGEPAWQLPMFDEFAEQIKSPIADIKNIGDGRWGGAITAAKFLEEFVSDVPWTHIDIAGPAYLEKEKPWSDGGGSGVMVRTLVEVARRWG